MRILVLLSLFFYYFFFSLLPPPPTSTLFPYTTLFRSRRVVRAGSCRVGATAADRFSGNAVEAINPGASEPGLIDRKSTRLNSSHVRISYAVFCLKKKKKKQQLDSNQ